MDFWTPYKKYQKIYSDLYMAHKEDLEGVAESYDRWFLGDFADAVKKQCNFKGDNLAPTEVEVVSGLVSQTVTNASRLIYPIVSAYMLEYFDDFYIQGLKLAQLNAQIENRSVDTTLTDEDKISIELMVNTELTVWKRHIDKHLRQVDRELTGAMQAGRTLDYFLIRMVCPDGHVCAYPYGNSRISWYEHIRRFLAGRPRLVATTAQMRRLL